MRQLVVLVLAGCGAPVLSHGPTERVHEPPPVERIGRGAELEIQVSYGTPADKPPRPAWLAADGDPLTPELATELGPKAFHNGRTIALAKVRVTPDGAGAIALDGCPPIRARDATVAELAVRITTCVTRYVDNPQAIVRIDRNPAWNVTVALPAGTRHEHLLVGETLTGLLASLGPAFQTGSEDAIRSQRVSLNGVAIDIWAIVTGEAPDLPLRPGDEVRLEPL